MSPGDSAEITSLDSLEELFTRITNSDRFMVLRSVQLSGVVSDIREIPSLSNLTIGELVELGHEEFFARCEDHPDALRTACKRLDDFFAPQDEPASLLPSGKLRKHKGPALNAKVGGRHSLSGVESIEATQRLVELRNSFKKLPNLAQFEDHSLEQFWEPTWPRAPFEETLKFKQILSLDIDSFVRKRSMSAQKTAAFIQALEKAYVQFSGGGTVPLPAAKKVQIIKARDNLDNRWSRESIAQLPLHCQSFLNAFETECRKTSETNALLPRILQDLPFVLTAKELLCLWFQNEYSQSTIAEITALNSKDLISTQRGAVKKISSMLHNDFAAELSNLQAILSGAGNSNAAIINIFGDAILDPSFQKGVATLILRAIGAKPLEINGETFEDHWVMDQRFMAVLFDLIYSSLPMQDLRLRAELKALLPMLPIKQLISAFAKKAEMHPEKRIWKRK